MVRLGTTSAKGRASGRTHVHVSATSESVLSLEPGITPKYTGLLRNGDTIARFCTDEAFSHALQRPRPWQKGPHLGTPPLQLAKPCTLAGKAIAFKRLQLRACSPVRPRRWGCTMSAVLMLPLHFLLLYHPSTAAPGPQGGLHPVLIAQFWSQMFPRKLTIIQALPFLTPPTPYTTLHLCLHTQGP